METDGLQRLSVTHNKALNNDEANGCARRVHFTNFIMEIFEYYLFNCDNAVLVGPPKAKANRGSILKIVDFRNSFFFTDTAKSGKIFSVCYYFFFLVRIFFSSAFRRRSTFFTSSPAGSASGRIPRSSSIFRTALLLSTCSRSIPTCPWRSFC